MLDTPNDPSKVMTFAAMVNIGGNESFFWTLGNFPLRPGLHFETNPDKAAISAQNNHEKFPSMYFYFNCHFAN